MTNRILMTAGRTLLGLYFLLPGLMKIAAWDMHIDMMSTQGIPGPAALLAIATAAEIIAGIFLILRIQVRLMSLGCALLVLVINLMMHNFWNFEGLAAAHEMQNFIKNLGIFAGLLVLAAAAPSRKLSLTRFWTRDVKA
jgi:putative oxidoreductase